ncbi:TPA: hypothetical protein QH079_002305 [Enterobacter roggenkampii]|nr:hypothetical protein [Enterobacter roggenkampii]
METVSVNFRVVITFDITVGNRSGMYKKVSDLLADNGFEKESPSGEDFPENVYSGITKRDVQRSDGVFSAESLKGATEKICNRVAELLTEFFEQNDLESKIFVHASRLYTSTTLLK